MEIQTPAPGLLGTGNWGTSILMGVLAGMLYGGSKEAAASIVLRYRTRRKEEGGVSGGWTKGLELQTISPNVWCPAFGDIGRQSLLTFGDIAGASNGEEEPGKCII